MILEEIKNNIIDNLKDIIIINEIDAPINSNKLDILINDKSRILICLESNNLYIPSLIIAPEFRHKGIGKNIISIVFSISKKYNYNLYLVDLVDSFYLDLLLRGASKTNSNDSLLITDNTNLYNNYYKPNEKIDKMINMYEHFRSYDDLFTSICNIVRYKDNIDFNNLDKYPSVIVDLIYINLCSQYIRLNDFGDNKIVYDRIFELLNDKNIFNNIIKTYNNIELIKVSNILNELVKLDFTTDYDKTNELLYELKDINLFEAITSFCKKYNIPEYD